ncbi:MAG TPA: RIP metalloprotease RseP [Verrucomicrobiae bacterium]
MTILHYIFIALEVVLIFNLIIGVHELGHFLAARWRGLKVERFAIWFGKPIWKKKIGDVEYVLGTIPFGGYVSLPQMATMEAIEGKGETPAEPLPNVSALDKIIVAFAGPLFSFLLAFMFALVVWGVGKPSNEADNSTVIGWVMPDGPAWQAGLKAGDKIESVDGHPVNNFQPTGSLSDSIKWRIITSTGTNVAIQYVRDGKEATAYVVPTNQPTPWYMRRSLRQIFVSSANRAIIYQIVSNSPAALAGLKPGDEVIAMNGRKIYSSDAIDYVQQSMSNGVVKPLTFAIRRGDEHFERTLMAVRPELPTNAPPMTGIVAWQGDTNVMLVHPGPMQQIETSAGQIFSTLGALFASKSQLGVQQLGGAVMIARVYYTLFQDEDAWRRVLWFSVVLNVNLALLNMLPLPVLDGGHITLSLIEVVRRRPVSARIVSFIQNGFAALLIFFMIYIAFFDIGDWVRSARADRDVPVTFAPASAGSLPDGKPINIAPIN